MILLSEQSFLPFCKEGVVLEKKGVCFQNLKFSYYV